MPHVQRQVRITGAERQALAQLLREQYEGGATIRAIATAIGRSDGFVHQLLREADATLRAHGGSRGEAQAA
ncbi:helix-turn-helix domain-containing protein [Nonomuraea sp. NPDC050328]|uniref:helix-turn-helix domain-containing protein n=1 Tax=Nonomuraea sp. NPDC050328 TaxID=3364361 RepID=UPI0037A33CF3